MQEIRDHVKAQLNGGVTIIGMWSNISLVISFWLVQFLSGCLRWHTVIVFQVLPSYFITPPTLSNYLSFLNKDLQSLRFIFVPALRTNLFCFGNI